MIEINNYKIAFDSELNLDEFLQEIQPSRIVVLTDENTVEFCLPLLYEECTLPFNIITIPSGEIHKNIETCNYIWSKMVEYKMDRHSVLINLGGGVIGDMGGFCAATFMRGIKFIHIPTTLLSQVDSSVGGKLGVDLSHFKNMVGVFADPIAVMIQTKYLTTLPYRQLASGFAEIVKHGLIANEALWVSLWEEDIITDLDLKSIIHKSVEIKAKIVREDPYEMGVRKTLNFGHTIGHAIESHSLSTENPLLHGEAISIGMITEAFISFKKGFIPIEKYEIIKNKINKSIGKKIKSIPSTEIVFDIMQHDKKNIKGKVMMSLLSDIGKSTFNNEVTLEEVAESMEAYKI